MGNFISIIKRNNSTFYDNRSGEQNSVLPRQTGFILVSLLVAWVLGTPSDTVVSSVITVQSILVGFGFSVLFFLVSSDHVDENAATTRENKERRKRLNKLSDELFFNISYYNIVTIISVLLSMLFAFDISSIKTLSVDVSNAAQLSQIVVTTLTTIADVAHRLLISIFYFVFFESVYTFYRIVVRVNFYFEQKRKISTAKGG